MDIEPLLRSLFFLLGAIVGSFLNVCIVRLPKGKSVVFPGSHCVRCGNPVRWFDNIPMLSYILLRGKCRDCGASFSVRYAFIELLTAGVFLGFYVYYGISWVLLPYLLLVSGCIVATFVDFEHRIIPDEISAFGIPLAVILSWLIPASHPSFLWDSAGVGFWVSIVFVMIAIGLSAVEFLIKRSPLNREDFMFWALILGLCVFQGIFCVLANQYPLWSERALASASAIQGVIIGGGVLYVTGLFGSLVYQKRVVSEIDLKEATEASRDLFQALIQAGYIDEGGTILVKFKALSSDEKFELPAGFQDQKRKIFEVIRSMEEAGIMGGGDVKLLAVIGAFLGWELALVAFFVAPFFGGVVGIVQKIVTKSSAIAYGPYLVLGAMVGIFWGRDIIIWLMRGYSL